MDLDDFKEKWAEQDRKLERNLQVNRRILQEIQIGHARTELQGLVPSLILEAILTFVMIVALGDFIYENITIPKFVFPALVLDIVWIVLLGVLIQQILLIGQIDPSQPVAVLQKRVGMLRLLRIRGTQWVLMVSPLIWIPLLIVAFKGFLGVDAYQIFEGKWLIANIIFGIVFLACGIVVANLLRGKVFQSPWVQYVSDTLAGNRLKSAQGYLKSLSEFVDG